MSEIVLGIRLTADGKQLAGEVRISREELAKLREEVGRNTSEAAKLNNEQKNLAQGMNATANSIGVASAAWTKMFDIVFQAAGALKDYIKEATLLNARHETMGVVLGVVGRNAGYSRGEMELYAESVRKTGITMIESRESVVKMVQANLDLSIASKLARSAQDAAVIANINSSEAFARMIHGIQAGQTEILRTMGINVNFEESYKKLAKQLKVNVDQLTEQEKTQARANVTLDATVQIMGTYEAAMGTAGKQLNSLARYEEDLKVLRGQIFNEALVIAVNNYTNSLKGATDEAQRLQTQGDLREWGRNIINTFAWVADIVRGAWDVIAQGVESTAVVILQALEKISAVQVGMGLRSALVHNEMTQYVASFTAVADQNMAARLGRTQMRDTAAGFFAQRDAEAAQKALEGRYDDWGYTPPQAAPSRPAGKTTGGSDMRDFVRQLKEQVEITKQNTIEEKILFELREKHWKNATPQLRQQAIDYARQLDLRKQEEQILAANLRYYEYLAGERDRQNDAVNQFNTANTETLQQLDLETKLIGKSREQQELLTGLTKLESEYRKASANLTGRAAESARELYEQQRRDLEDAIRGKNAAQLIQDQIDDSRDAAKKMNEDLQRGLTDSIFRGFEAGKGFARNFRDSLVNMFRTTILRPVIQWVVSPVTGAITGALGGLGIPGLANAAGGGAGGLGGLGNLSGISDMFGGLVGGANAVFQNLGVNMGSQFLADIGNFGFGVPVLGGLTNLLMGNTRGAIGSTALGIAGTMIGGPIGGAIGSFVGSMFGGSDKGGPAYSTGYEVNGAVTRGGFAGDWYHTSANKKRSFRWEQAPDIYGAGTANQVYSAYNNIVGQTFSDLERMGKLLGLDTGVLDSASVNLSMSGIGKPGEGLKEMTDAFRAAMGQVTDDLALKLMPNLREFAKANETLTQTLVRLAAAREQAKLDEIFGRMGGALQLADQTRDLWLSELSPLTASQRLAEAQGRYAETFAAAQSGDVSALAQLSGISRNYLGEARSYYASSASYTDIFNQVQGQIGNLVEDTLIEQSIAFSEMSVSLEDIVANTNNLDKRIAAALEAAITARSESDAAAVRAQTEELVRSNQDLARTLQSFLDARVLQ